MFERDRDRDILAILQTQLNATSCRKPSRNSPPSQMWSPFAPVPNSQVSKHFPSCVSLCDCVSHGLSSAPGSCQHKAGTEVVPRDACETEPHSPSHRYRRQPTKLCSHLRPNTQLVLVVGGGGRALKVKTWLPEWGSR